MDTDDDVVADVDGSLDLSSLSPREREVLDQALKGGSVAAIAATLSLSEATIRSHLTQIYAKLGVSGRLELLARMKGAPPLTELPAALPHGRRSIRLSDPSTLAKLAMLAAIALVLGLGAGFVVIGAFNVVLPFRYPEDDDTLRERIPVVLAYLTWVGTSIVVFVAGLRLTIIDRRR
ncbi:MAG: helix-turn-helix domain-containing protein [Candidatus Limnocylindrales bacterium]